MNEENKGINPVYPISIILLVAFSFGYFVFDVYNNYGDSLPTYWNSKFENNCGVVVSERYKIVSNGDRYAVTVKTYSRREFLWSRTYGISTAFSPWTTFPDSCTAKQYYLEYLKQERQEKQELEGFK